MHTEPSAPGLEINKTLDPSFAGEQPCSVVVLRVRGAAVPAVSTSLSTSLSSSLSPSLGARGVTVEIWLARSPRFGLDGLTDHYDASDFEHAADFLLESAGGYGDDGMEALLESAYRASQNIDEAWRTGAPCRSCSVGDVLVLRTPERRQAYVVANLGFEKTALG